MRRCVRFAGGFAASSVAVFLPVEQVSLVAMASKAEDSLSDAFAETNHHQQQNSSLQLLAPAAEWR